MARVAKASTTTRSATTARKPESPAKVSVAAPKVSKDELRAQVEKLGQLVVSLRAKSREANKAAKAATARIAELEAQVARLGKKVTPTPVGEPKPAKPGRAKRRGREIDPGDAAPPDVAIHLDSEAETGPENLDAHLTDE
jgi:septal ring factor EnvC (AmiA/AmiB activator)